MCGDWTVSVIAICTKALLLKTVLFLFQNVNANSKISYITGEIEQALYATCDCDVQIQMPQLFCRDQNQNFAIFRGQLFAPLNISGQDLLALLEDWVTRGNTMTVFSINSNCRPSTLYADDAACVTSVDIGTTTSDDVSVGIVISAAVGCFVVGVIITLITVLSCYLLKKR